MDGRTQLSWGLYGQVAAVALVFGTVGIMYCCWAKNISLDEPEPECLPEYDIELPQYTSAVDTPTLPNYDSLEAANSSAVNTNLVENSVALEIDSQPVERQEDPPAAPAPIYTP
jgi:hypothetical protein